MRSAKSLFALIFALILSVPCLAKVQKVYVFGVGYSFVDSLCVMTDVQGIDSCVVNKEGFLVGRPLYSLQLENYMLRRGVKEASVAVFWDEKRARLEKKYLKLRKRAVESPDMKLQYTNVQEFKFDRVEVPE